MEQERLFAVRYVGRDPRGGKDITPAEADALAEAGVARVIVYQPRRAFVPTWDDNGVEAAKIAHFDTSKAGMPPDRPIFFAVDGDTRAWTEQQWLPVEQFFRDAASVLGLVRMGVYGGKNTVERLVSRGFAIWRWQTYAWSDGQWADVHLRQYLNGQTMCGGQVDFCQAMKTDYGQW